MFSGEEREEAKGERAEAKAERAALEANMREEKAALEASMQEERALLQAKVVARQATAEEESRERQLSAFQSRLQSMHASKLLTDEELYKLEDAIADGMEEDGEGGGQAVRMVGQSEQMVGDAALARQLRRKFA